MRGQCHPPKHPPPAIGPLHAHLWFWGSPKGSGLFSPSMVWGDWWAPGAGTEVVGSLVALWGQVSGVTIMATLLDAPALSCLCEQGRKEGTHSPGLHIQRPWELSQAGAQGRLG